MTAAELYAEWDDLTMQERMEGLTEVINDTLSDAGYAEVDVGVDDLSGESASGHFDSSDNSIELDSDHVMNGDPADVLDTAFHEAAHAMEFQDGDYDTLSDEEKADYNDMVGIEGFITDEGDIDIRGTFSPEHQDIYDYAANAVERALAEDPNAMSGAPASPGSAGGSPSSGAEGAESGYGTSGDIGFEIDFESAVVTDGDGYVIEMQLDQATVNP